jgi:hypothetical protein
LNQLKESSKKTLDNENKFVQNDKMNNPLTTTNNGKKQSNKINNKPTYYSVPENIIDRIACKIASKFNIKSTISSLKKMKIKFAHKYSNLKKKLISNKFKKT